MRTEAPRSGPLAARVGRLSAAPAARDPRAHPARERLLRHLREEGGDPDLLRVLQDAAAEEERKRQRRAARDRGAAAKGLPATGRRLPAPGVALVVAGGTVLLVVGIAALR